MNQKVQSAKIQGVPPTMKLLAISLLLCAAILVPLSIPGFCQISANTDQPSQEQLKQILEQNASQTGTVVYAIKDIAKGEQIKAEALEEKQMLATTISPEAIESAKSAIGNYATYDIKAGQLLYNNDISSQDSFTIKLDPSSGKKLRSLAKSRKEQEELVVKWVKDAIDKESDQ